MCFISVNGIDFKCDELLGRTEWSNEAKRARLLTQIQMALVTGGAGSIGSHLVEMLTKNGVRTVVVDCDEYRLHKLSETLSDCHCTYLLADVSDERQVKNIIQTYTPDCIFHLAAKKHVKFAERSAHVVAQTNVLGTLNVLEAMDELPIKSKLVLASSDKSINATINTKNILGITKLLSEQLVLSFLLLGERTNSEAMKVVRLCNAHGTSGNVLETFVNRCLRRQPLEVHSEDLSRYFCCVHEATDLLVEALDRDHNEPILTLNVGDSTPITELAQKVVCHMSKQGFGTSYYVSEIIEVMDARHEQLLSQSEQVTTKSTRTPGVDLVTPTAEKTMCYEDLCSALRKIIQRSDNETALTKRLRDVVTGNLIEAVTQIPENEPDFHKGSSDLYEYLNLKSGTFKDYKLAHHPTRN